MMRITGLFRPLLAVGLLAVSLALPAPVAAVQPDEVLADTVLEERARDISAGLRCVVCRNESIDESNADLARDLRLLVRERLVIQKLEAVAAVLPEVAEDGVDVPAVTALIEAELSVGARAPRTWESLAAEMALPEDIVLAASNAADARLAEAEDANAAVVGFIVDRYGEYVLLRPTFSGANLALWAAGPLLLILGLAMALAYLRRRSQSAPATEAALSPEEEARLAEIIAETDPR